MKIFPHLCSIQQIIINKNVKIYGITIFKLPVIYDYMACINESRLKLNDVGETGESLINQLKWRNEETDKLTLRHWKTVDVDRLYFHRLFFLQKAATFFQRPYYFESWVLSTILWLLMHHMKNRMRTREKCENNALDQREAWERSPT